MKPSVKCILPFILLATTIRKMKLTRTTTPRERKPVCLIPNVSDVIHTHEELVDSVRYNLINNCGKKEHAAINLLQS